MVSEIEKVKKILSEIIYIVVGTVDNRGYPWTTPLFYATDDEFNFYWVSPKNSVHSQNLKQNKTISVVCFDSTTPKWTGVGVYMVGEAFELESNDEIEKGIKLIFNKLEENIPTIDDYKNGAEYRVYKAHIHSVWITSETEVDGKIIDGRKEVDIKLLFGEEY